MIRALAVSWSVGDSCWPATSTSAQRPVNSSRADPIAFES